MNAMFCSSIVVRAAAAAAPAASNGDGRFHQKQHQKRFSSSSTTRLLRSNDNRRRARHAREEMQSRDRNCVILRATTGEDDDNDEDALDSVDSSSSKNLARRLDSLLVPFLALRRGSRFAHQEFVMAATEAYDDAISLAKLKTETYLLGLSNGSNTEARVHSTAQNMGTSEQEAFLSHLSMVYCTLHYMGRASKKTEEFLVDPEKDKELKGILGYIKMTHTNRDEHGITLKRMEFEQRRVLNASEPNEDPRKYSKWDKTSGRNPNAKVNDVRQITPGILLMRTNARLTLLAKEMVEGPEGRKKDLPDVSEDEGEEISTATTTTTTTTRKIEPQLALEWIDRPANDPELLLKRTLAARALTAFFSVLTAHPKGLKAFSRACIDAYEANISAEDLVQSVSAAEFDCEASTRGMFGKGADAPKLFAGFVSAAYLTAEYRLEKENKQQEKKKTFAFANPPRWEEIDLSNEDQDDIESRKKGNAYDYNFEFDEEKQIKYLEGFKTSIARWVSIGEKELFADVSTGLSVDEDNDEYDFDAAFKTAAAKQLQNMTDAPFADYDVDEDDGDSMSYQPTEEDEPVLDVNALYAKLLFEVSEYIGNQSDQPKVAALLQAYTQKILNAPIVQPPSLSQKSYDPESGKFVTVVSPPSSEEAAASSFKRNDFFAQSSITLASLNVQRAVCSFVLKEMASTSSSN